MPYKTQPESLNSRQQHHGVLKWLHGLPEQDFLSRSGQLAQFVVIEQKEHQLRDVVETAETVLKVLF